MVLDAVALPRYPWERMTDRGYRVARQSLVSPLPACDEEITLPIRASVPTVSGLGARELTSRRTVGQPGRPPWSLGPAHGCSF